MKIFVVVVVAIFAWPLLGYAQSGPEWIWNPELSYSKDTSDRMTLGAKLSIFHSFEDFTEKRALEYIEQQFTGAYTLTPRWKIGGGYYYRLSNPLLDGYEYEHRLLQQAGYISYFGDRRLSHRFRLEQRIRSSSYQNRFRYRVGFDFPLQGEQLDPGERYLIIKNEIMTAFNGSEADAENRASLGIGWLLGGGQKFEVNAQHRTQDIFSGNGVGHLLLLNTTFYISR